MKKINTDKINICKLRKYIAFIVVLFFFFKGFSQQQMLPLGELYQKDVNFNINKVNYAVNTGFKPLLKSEINEIFNVDSVIYQTEKTESFFQKHKRNLFYRKLFFEDFISVEKPDFTLYVNPLFYIETGKVSSIDSVNYFINTRGIEIKGDIGKKISYFSTFRENQARFRDYIYERAWDRLVVPGQGAMKKNTHDLSLYDFSSAAAYLSYTPYHWLNIQFGQGKNFIGEGHSSLFLSDNAMNYPFAKFSFTFKGFKYVSMFTQFQDFEKVYYSYHFKKHAAFNYLSYNYKNRVELGLFEGVMYRTTDTSEFFNRFPADFFIPITGVRTIINGFGGTNNVLVGINIKIKITDFIQTYGQFAIDDPKQKKYAFQGGLKVFDILYSKLEGVKWYFQLEYIEVLPKTYSHADLKYQTWTHYNEELSSYFGNDFSEIYLNSNISFKNFLLDFRYNFISLNRNGTFSDIYMLDNYNYSVVPEKQFVTHKTLSLAYIINRRTNLQIYTGADIRNDKNFAGSIPQTYILFGLRTSLNNFYYDF